MLKLNLGCWNRPLNPNNGWKNIDKIYVPGVDLVEDARYLRSFKEGTVDVIYSSHILDQFSRWEYLVALKRWHSLLKPGGQLYVSVPDFDAVVARYNETRNVQELIGLLHGGQDHDGWTRSMSWNFESLREDLMCAGFFAVKHYCWQDTEFCANGRDDYSMAYLPDRDLTGRLMSLNVVAHR